MPSDKIGDLTVEPSAAAAAAGACHYFIPHLGAFVTQSAHVNPHEQSLSPAQQDRRNSQVQLVDETLTKILLDSVSSAANAHIHSAGGIARPVKRLVNTARDEVECRSTFHLDGRARVMSQK